MQAECQINLPGWVNGWVSELRVIIELNLSSMTTEVEFPTGTEVSNYSIAQYI